MIASARGEHDCRIRKVLAEAFAARNREQLVQVEFNPHRFENQEMHTATLHEILLDYQNRTRAQRWTKQTVDE